MNIQFAKQQKWLFPFGVLSVVFFFTHTILGNLLRREYHPTQQPISELTADGAPYAHLLRVFVMLYEVCLLIFIVGMIYEAFRRHGSCVRIGYILLFITSLTSIIGFNAFPMTLIFIVSIQNLMHTIVTIALFCFTILSVILIAIGYLKEKRKALGWTSLATAILPILFSLAVWLFILNGGRYYGLWERLTIYPFHAFVFIISWRYCMKEYKT